MKKAGLVNGREGDILKNWGCKRSPGLPLGRLKDFSLSAASCCRQDKKRGSRGEKRGGRSREGGGDKRRAEERVIRKYFKVEVSF